MKMVIFIFKLPILLVIASGGLFTVLIGWTAAEDKLRAVWLEEVRFLHRDS